MFAAMRQLTAERGEVFDDLAAVHDWLAGNDDCAGPIGVIGFCMEEGSL